jgi:branched-chain amino acid transport system ATP-binding protein
MGARTGWPKVDAKGDLKMQVKLRCADVSVSFGAFQALVGISADFQHDRTCAVIGPNGAGKTTFLNVLSGVQRPSHGSVILDGTQITYYTPQRRARLGIGRSFQIAKIFPELTVRQNLRVGAQRIHFSFPPFWIPAGSNSEVERTVEEVLQLVHLEKLADVEVGRLSHGNQRAVEIGLTLVTNPSVLLLDEPLAGVGHHEVSEMVSLLKKICRGRTTILIEHNMDAVMEIADEILVFVSGKLLTRGNPADVRRDPAVRTAYLGT